MGIRRWTAILFIAIPFAILGLGGVGYLVVYPIVRIEMLFRRAGRWDTTYADGQHLLTEMRLIRPHLVAYLRRKAASENIDDLERLIEILKRHPGLDRFNCDIVEAELEGPNFKKRPEPEAEELVRLYLEILSSGSTSLGDRFANIHAQTLELIGLWTSAPRSILAWTRLNLYGPPNQRIIAPAGQVISPTDLAPELPKRATEIERTRVELIRWADLGKDKFVFGKFDFGENGLPEVKNEIRIAGGMRAGFCGIAEQSPPRRIPFGVHTLPK